MSYTVVVPVTNRHQPGEGNRLAVTSFWGGAEHGRMIQITASGGSGQFSNGIGYVSMTFEQTDRLTEVIEFAREFGLADHPRCESNEPLQRVIVCGGRDYDDYATVEKVVRSFLPFEEDDWKPTFVHGDARGLDKMAGLLAQRLGFPVENFPADWQRDGRGAGPIRNRRMLDAGADLVVAFPGGKGTENMVEQAKKAGVRVWRIPA